MKQKKEMIKNINKKNGKLNRIVLKIRNVCSFHKRICRNILRMRIIYIRSVNAKETVNCR